MPYDIERIGPTRIYPPATYEMKFKIKANQDFQGEIKETVPASFEILRDSTSPNYQYQEIGSPLYLKNSEIALIIFFWSDNGSSG